MCDLTDGNQVYSGLGMGHTEGRTSRSASVSDIDASPMDAHTGNRNYALDIAAHIDTAYGITSWDNMVFSELCNSKGYVSCADLIDAYDQVMTSYGLRPMPQSFIENSLKEARPDGAYLAMVNNSEVLISNPAFYRTLRYYATDLRWRICNYTVVQAGVKRTMWLDWHRNGVQVVATIIDIVVCGSAMAIISKSTDLLSWITLIYVMSALVSTNIMYYIMTSIDVSSVRTECCLLPKLLPSEFFVMHRTVFAMKTVVAYACYAIGHLLQISSVLQTCRHGCNKADIRIVGTGGGPIRISWMYFLAKPMYWLTIVIVGAAISIYVMERMRIMPSAAVAFTAVCIIAQQWLDHASGNMHIGILLMLVVYMADHWRDIYGCRFNIDQYKEFDKFVRVHINPKQCLVDFLQRFNCVLIDTGHISLARRRYVRCIATCDYRDAYKYVVINRDALKEPHEFSTTAPISIGRYELSKFRFYHLYDMACMFCKDAGIYAFIAVVHHRKSTHARNHIKLIWVVSDMGILIEFNDALNYVRMTAPDIDINIYYCEPSSKPIASNVLVRFNYLQCVIFRHTSTDILSCANGSNYCILGRANAYDIINGAISTINAMGLHDAPMGVFACGDTAFIQNVKINTSILRRNHYGTKLRIWTDCI